jgi:hypothetical protein
LQPPERLQNKRRHAVPYRRRAFLYEASEALRLAQRVKKKLDHTQYDLEIDLDIVHTAREAADAWSDISQFLGRCALPQTDF